MSSSIHYKFRTTNVSKTLGFDGQAIKVQELKKAICAAENIKAELFDLMFFNSFNKQPYTGDDEIPRNSSVTVQRVPIENGAKIPKISNPEISAATAPTPGVPDSAAHIKSEDFSKMTEEERIKHITVQSTFKYTTNNYNRKPMGNHMQQAPLDYLCNRCNQHGHFPRSCPMVMLNIKKTTGIPNEELMETTADDPQALLHPSGKFMIQIMHYKAREQRKLLEEQRKNGLQNPQEYKNASVKKELPPDLKCSLCNDIFKEAISTSCCQESYCADCIQQVMSDAIAADTASQCPNCKTEIGASALIPNTVLRETVDRYKKSLNTVPVVPESEEEQEADEPLTNEPEVFSPAQPIENDAKPESPVAIMGVALEKPVVILPTVNLSEMLANKVKQSSVPPPEAIADFSHPPPIIPVIPVVDFSKPPPNFKLPDFSQPPPIIPPVAPKKDALPSPTSDAFHVPPPLPKPKISGTNYDEKDEEAINNAWEKLNVGDDTLNLATLFESRTSYVTKKEVDEKNGKEKERRIKNRSKSRDRQRHRDERRTRSRSPHKKRRESSKERESSSSKKRSKEREDRHRTTEKRSSDYREKNKEKENGKKKEIERKEEQRRSDEQKEIRSRDLERQRKYEEEEKKVVKIEQEEKKIVKVVPKLPSESPKRREEDVIDKHNVKKVSSNEKSEKRRSSSKREKTDFDESGPSHQEFKEEVRETVNEKKKEKVKERERSKDNGKEREKKKERDHKEKSEKKKSRKKDKSEDTVEREKEKKKSSSKEKKKSKSEEKKKKKRRKTVSDQSDEEEEKQKKKRHKEKKHKKDRKRERENVGDDSGDDRRKRRKV